MLSRIIRSLRFTFISILIIQIQTREITRNICRVLRSFIPIFWNIARRSTLIMQIIWSQLDKLNNRICNCTAQRGKFYLYIVEWLK
uniref:Candidate secreted effector n=1 Tax=Meloidogyne incognita TaxID=6306 RepID=A0A914KUS4_MELIC